MNSYVKEFFKRGMAFGGFGPIIMGIIYAILEKSIVNFSLGGAEVFIAIISTYILAFVQAGASVFNQIEHWPLSKSLLFHFLSIYLAYVLCYTVNTWIPFEPKILLIFTAIFVISYLVIWFTVYLITKLVTKKLNSRL